MRNKCEWKKNVFYPCDNFRMNGILIHEGEAICSECNTYIDEPIDKTAKEKAIQKFAHGMYSLKNSMDVLEQGRVIVETIETYLKNLSE